MQASGFELLLPDGVLYYFEKTQVDQKEKEISIVLEERNEIPEEYQGHRLESKGFYENAKIQAFRSCFREVRSIPFFLFRLTNIYACPPPQLLGLIRVQV